VTRRSMAAGRRLREAGQASIELLGILPVVVLVALAGAQALAAGLAHTAAGGAAEAAAMAVLQGGDPQRAARAAAPGWARERVTVRVSGRHVRVRVVPPALVPGTERMLTADAQADAGPVS
jgi:hypothetical protein